VPNPLFLHFLGLAIGSALAQRHGRPDSLQNYMASQWSGNPVLNINFKSTGTWRSSRLSDIRRIKRGTMDVIDSTQALRTITKACLFGNSLL
jgi:hypothetical protein